MTDEKSDTPEVEDAASTEEPDDEKAGEIVGGAGAVDEAESENVSGGSDVGWWNEPASN